MRLTSAVAKFEMAACEVITASRRHYVLMAPPERRSQECMAIRSGAAQLGLAGGIGVSVQFWAQMGQASGGGVSDGASKNLRERQTLSHPEGTGVSQIASTSSSGIIPSGVPAIAISRKHMSGL